MAQNHLNGLGNCGTAEVQKKDYENCKGQNSGVRSLRELRKVYR